MKALRIDSLDQKVSAVGMRLPGSRGTLVGWVGEKPVVIGGVRRREHKGQHSTEAQRAEAKEMAKELATVERTTQHWDCGPVALPASVEIGRLCAWS